MIIDSGARRSGKTTRLVEWARKRPTRIILTFNYRRAKQIESDFPDIAGKVYDIENYINNQNKFLPRHVTPDEIGIDDLELGLQRLLGAPVSQVSISNAYTMKDIKQRDQISRQEKYVSKARKKVNNFLFTHSLWGLITT